MGFLELKEMNLPSIPWKEYKDSTKLQEGILWTVRSAVYRGDDLNLPRLVGAKADEANQFALRLKNQLGINGMVIYYPYFIANKSGTLEVRSNSIVIEAVRDDLWNLVTYSDRDVTVLINEQSKRSFIGEKSFLTEDELSGLEVHVPEIRKVFREELLEGKSALFEWSYAVSCDESKNPLKEEYLVFYEARTVV